MKVKPGGSRAWDMGEPDVVLGGSRPAREATSSRLAPTGEKRSVTAAPTAAPAVRTPPLRRILVALDLAVVASGWVAARLLLADSSLLVVAGPLLFELLVLLPAAALLLSANGLYRRRICRVRAVEIVRTVRSVAMLGALMLAVLSAGAGRLADPVPVVAAAAAWLVLLVVERALLREWIAGLRARGAYGAPVLVVGGDGSATLAVARFLVDNPVLGFEVRGLVGPAGAAADEEGFPRLGELDELARIARESGVSGAVLDAGSLNGTLSAAVRTLTAQQLHVHVHSGLRGIERRRITLSPLVDETVLHVAPPGLPDRQRVAKRLLDVVVGAALLVLTGPLMLGAALAVRLGDGGASLYRQRRVGHQGEEFTLYKLRTMSLDADQRRDGLVGANEREGPLFKVSADPRVTRVGRWLRALSIDELPQLLNVLEGTMSLVGPRPALPEEVAAFDEELVGRLGVKPGMTGLWQTEARDLPSFELYRRYDLFYVESWSVGVDVAILCRTVGVVVMRALRLLTRGRGSQVLE